MILFGIGFTNLLLQNNLIKEDRYWTEYHGHCGLSVSGGQGLYRRKKSPDRGGWDRIKLM